MSTKKLKKRRGKKEKENKTRKDEKKKGDLKISTKKSQFCE